MTGRRSVVGAVAATTAVLAALLIGTATPVRADPSLGNWTATAGSYTANTTTLKITGPGANFTGQNDNGVATWTFGTVKIPAGATLTARGTRPFEIIADTSFTLGGAIHGDGGSATNFDGDGNGAATTGQTGGPGGGNGGPPYFGGGGPSGTSVGNGFGPGAGQAAKDAYSGAGGGGFGGVGATGGTRGSTPSNGGVGGGVYGHLLSGLQGGSGGAGASAPDSGVSGGGGGGAVEIHSPTGSITLNAGSTITVNGGSGAVGDNGASGGGSGGGLLIDAFSVTARGSLSADGGGGGRGGCCGGGGGGGGGRIAVVWHTLTNTATMTVAGGVSSSVDTNDCCPGNGSAAPANGGAGVVRVISPKTATAVSTSGPATVGGTETVNATVTNTQGPDGPTGTVAFTDQSGALCTAQVTTSGTSGTASCSFTERTVGAEKITATFTPTGPMQGSSGSTTLTVAGIPVPATGAAPGAGGGSLVPPLLLGGGAALLALGVRRRRH